MNLRLRRRTWAFIFALAAAGGALGVVARNQRLAKTAAAATTDTTDGPRSEPLTLPQRGAETGTLQTVRVERTPVVGDLQVVGSVSPAEDHFAVVGPSVRFVPVFVRVKRSRWAGPFCSRASFSDS